MQTRDISNVVADAANATKPKKKIHDYITVGADPEFWLVRDGKIISAHDIIPGTKDKPYPLKDGISIQADGTAVEFNIPPARTAKEFSESIQNGLDQIKGMTKGLTFSFAPVVTFSEEYFNKLPKTATELGCSPDFSSSPRFGKIAPPKKGVIGSTRVTGGHIHVGWGENIPIEPGHLFDCTILSRNLDNYFRSYDRFWDTDKVRRKYYGHSGAFRPKSYGVEYRGLSSMWLTYPELWPWIFNSTVTVFESLKSGRQIGQYWYESLTSTISYHKLYSSSILPSFPQIFAIPASMPQKPTVPSNYWINTGSTGVFSGIAVLR